MKHHLTGMGCHSHLPYRIPRCYLLPDTSEHNTS